MKSAQADDEAPPEIGDAPRTRSKAGSAGEMAGLAERQDPDLAELSERFPQFEWIEVLGRGGMGMVLKARQPEFDRVVAIKVLVPGVHNDPAFAERFAREARTMASLKHPNIVEFYDFGRSEDYIYLVMAYIGGFNLREILNSERLAIDETLRIVCQLCDALQYAHDQGIVHRDIKPENILIDVQGQAKVADFGLAKLLDQSDTAIPLTGRWERVGTPHYMAPEMIDGSRRADRRADIYSLGVVFYEMLTGELPREQTGSSSQRALIDSRLQEIVLRMLDSDPDRRYQQIEDLKTALTGCKEAVTAASSSAEGVGGSAWPPGGQTVLTRRFPTGCASVVIVLLTIAILVLWALFGGRTDRLLPYSS